MKTEVGTIPQLKVGVLRVKVIGTSPYLPEPVPIKVAEDIDNKKANKNIEKDNRTEAEKVKDKYYYTFDGKKGIPARAFFQAMVRASSYLFDKKDGGMRNVKEGVTVMGDILPLKYKSENVRKDIGRASGQTRAPRLILRNEFHEWTVDLEIRYNQSLMSGEQIASILDYAGFHIGVGGFRKEKSGSFGAFSVKA